MVDNTHAYHVIRTFCIVSNVSNGQSLYCNMPYQTVLLLSYSQLAVLCDGEIQQK